MVQPRCRIIIGIEILIGKPSETVSELVYNNRAETCMSSCCQRIEIVYPAATVLSGVGKNNDMFLRHVYQAIMHTFHITGSKIAVRIECAEIRTCGSRFPLPKSGHTYSAVRRRHAYCHKVELIGT